MEELNKKLLDFAGFDFLNNWGAWRYPDETHGNNMSAIAPDFADPEFGIAHCFKWLVPKVVEEGYLFLSVLFNDWLGELEEEKEPALALCLAIEKLIDGEK